MSVSEVLNLIALVVIPIAAVGIGQYLQTLAKKREDKMRVFESMMLSRTFGVNHDTVRAANMIHVVFAKDKCVRERWSEYYESLCIQDPSEEQLRDGVEKRDAMLKAMASSLGYKDEVSQSALDVQYIPKGMVDAMARNRMQEEAVGVVMTEAAQRFMTGQPFPKI